MRLSRKAFRLVAPGGPDRHRGRGERAGGSGRQASGACLFAFIGAQRGGAAGVQLVLFECDGARQERWEVQL